MITEHLHLLSEDGGDLLLEDGDTILIEEDTVNRVQIQLLEKGQVTRREALNSPLKQGASELTRYFADFDVWGASASFPVSAPVLKVLNQDDEDVTYGGHVVLVVVNDGGTGYEEDDVLTLTEAGSSGDATVTVVAAPGGVILLVSLTTVGYNYTTGSKDTTGEGNNDATITIATVTDAELIVKASVTVVGDTQIQFDATNFVTGDRYRFYIKGTVDSLIGEAWIYVDGEL